MFMLNNLKMPLYIIGAFFLLYVIKRFVSASGKADQWSEDEAQGNPTILIYTNELINEYNDWIDSSPVYDFWKWFKGSKFFDWLDDISNEENRLIQDTFKLKTGISLAGWFNEYYPYPFNNEQLEKLV